MHLGVVGAVAGVILRSGAADGVGSLDDAWDLIRRVNNMDLDGSRRMVKHLRLTPHSGISSLRAHGMGVKAGSAGGSVTISWGLADADMAR